VTAAEHVRAVRDSLPASREWDEREASLLGLAEAQARDIEALEAVIAERGVAAKDSWRLNAAVSEVGRPVWPWPASSARLTFPRSAARARFTLPRPLEQGGQADGTAS
jgi:hypothetical protein